MAFDQLNFAPVGGQTTDTPAFWSYKSGTDDLLTILTPAYFDSVTNLEINDLIYASGVDDQRIIRYLGLNTAPYIVAPKPPELVLEANDFIDQIPVGTDTGQIVTFGPAQNTVADPVMIDAAGRVTINQGGFYDILAVFQTGRVGSGGVSELHIRGLLDGAQASETNTTLLDNANVIIPESFEFQGLVPSGTFLEAEIIRDSNSTGAGSSAGGLVSRTVTAGWGTSPSAAIRVFRLL